MMFKLVISLCFVALAFAFSPLRVSRAPRTQLRMASDFQKAISATVIGASLFFGPSVRAEIDYDGVKYLGGGEKVDLNNANIRAYLKIPGLYPNIASKIVVGGPYAKVDDVYSIPGLSSKEKEVLKKNEGRFVVLDSKPEYVIDKINNGLYR